MKNQRAFEIPPILTPQGRRCVLIEIPDERIHIANFWGSLTSLTQWRSWKRDDDKSGKVLATLWKEIIYSAWDRFERGECCPEPEPCPEPQPQPQTGGGAGSGVGSMGYTIEELEEMLLMAITKIEYRNGELWYRDGCCDWYRVTEESGVQFVASSAINKPEGQTLQSWAAAGKPNLSVGQTPVGTDNPFYTTSDSMACAKATAITEFFQTLLSEVKDGVGTSALSITGLFQALATVSELLGFEDTGLIMEFATVVVGSITGGTALQFSNDVDTALADTHWNEVICASVPKMTPVVTVGPFTGNLVTEADVNAVYQEALSKIEMSDDVAQVLQTFPLSAIQNKVRQLLPAQDCGCEQFLPYGYVPPVASGSMRITFERLVKMTTGETHTNPLDGDPFSAIDELSGQDGAISGDFFKTAYTAQAGGYYFNYCGALLKVEGGAIRLDNVAGSLIYETGEPSARIDVEAWTYDSVTEQWENPSYVEDTSSPFLTSFSFSAGAKEDVTYILIELYCQTTDSGANKQFRINSLNFSGDFNGNGFENLDLGATFTP